MSTCQGTRPRDTEWLKPATLDHCYYTTPTTYILLVHIWQRQVQLGTRYTDTTRKFPRKFYSQSKCTRCLVINLRSNKFSLKFRMSKWYRCGRQIERKYLHMHVQICIYKYMYLYISMQMHSVQSIDRRSSRYALPDHCHGLNPIFPVPTSNTYYTHMNYLQNGSVQKQNVFKYT